MRARVCVFGLLLASLVAPAAAVAKDFAIDLEAQPIGASLAYLQRPGDSSPRLMFDSASGVHARLDVYFMYLALDYQHFYDQAFDQVSTGVGAEFELPIELAADRTNLRFYARVELDFLFLAMRAADPDTPDAADWATRMGGQVAGGLGFEVDFAQVWCAGLVWDVGAHYTGDFGFHVQLNGFAGLRF
jgi:hypothetical protein